jgi:hypothetical protein
MLRALVVGAVIATAVGSTTYASQDTSQAPAVAIPAADQDAQAAAQGPAPSAADKLVKQGVAGVYLCEGANPDGSPYKGVVEIVAIDSTFLVRWSMADGAEVLGVGIRNSNVLSVSYFGGTPAVVVYQIDGDRLVGEWTMGGAEGMLYSETLTRLPDVQPSQPLAPQERPRPRPRTRPVAGSRSV